MRYFPPRPSPAPLAAAAPAIRAALADPTRCGLLLDFDGTLAPIVRRPERARCADAVRRALANLAKTYRVVGVVSGRGIADLSGRVSVPGLWLVGSHGAVIRPPNRDEVSAQPTGVASARLAALAVDLEGLPRIRVEAKETAVAFHYRGQEGEGEVVTELRRRVSEAAAAADLAVGDGRCVIEARIPGIDKGAALTQIVDWNDLSVAVVAGDDWTDLDAFRAAHCHPRCQGIALGVASAEMPPPLAEEADVLAGGVRELSRWLISLTSSAGQSFGTAANPPTPTQ